VPSSISVVARREDVQGTDQPIAHASLRVVATLAAAFRAECRSPMDATATSDPGRTVEFRPTRASGRMPPLTREQWRAGYWSGDVARDRGADPPRLSAFNDRDLDAVLAGLHDEVDAFPRLAAVEGGYRGLDGIRRWWAQLLGAFPDFQVEILEVRDLGEFIVLALRLRGVVRRATRPLTPRSGM
jgi:hypothetical protein